MDACPSCGSPLEKGFLNTNREVFWDTKIHKRIFGRAGGEVVIPPSWSVQNVEADRCPKCKLILFKYGRRTELPQATMPYE